jgi:hypothetical protein
MFDLSWGMGVEASVWTVTEINEFKKSYLKKSPVVADILVADLKVGVYEILNGAYRFCWLC